MRGKEEEKSETRGGMKTGLSYGKTEEGKVIE